MKYCTETLKIIDVALAEIKGQLLTRNCDIDILYSVIVVDYDGHNVDGATSRYALVDTDENERLKILGSHMRELEDFSKKNSNMTDYCKFIDEEEENDNS